MPHKALIIPGPPARRRSLVSITPLVDVVFILLFFFMLASSFDRWQSIDLKLQSSQAPLDAQTKSQVLQVRAGPQVNWQGEWLAPDLLPGHMQQTDPQLVLILEPGADTAIQDLISVLETIRAQRRNRVLLAVAR